tara:strand:- start:3189 stop:3731 length:543 start_codon:yes stop_codon:yes gene_type:complete
MKSRGIFLNIVIVVAVLTVVFSGALLFLQFELSSLKEEILALETQYATSETQQSNLIATQRLLERTKEDREKINKYFIENESEIVSFLKEVEALGDPYGMVPQVSVDANTSEGGTSSLSLDISVEGSFNEVYTYLLLLENFPAKTSLNSVSVRKLNDGPLGVTPRWSMRVLMSVDSYLSS